MAAKSDRPALDPASALRLVLSGGDGESEQGREAREILGQSLEVKPAIPEKTPERPARFLTIGMATFDDFDGCYFTVQSIQLHHPEIRDQIEFVIVDNNPTGEHGRAVKALETVHPNSRYIPYRSLQSPAVKQVVFREATGEWVLCMDSHVMFPPGSLARLIEYCRRHPGSKDLLTGPLLIDNVTDVFSHQEPEWIGPYFGRYANDERANDADAAPFEIPMAGCGVFACRREAWPGYNPRFASYGGEEGYIHEKIRRAGGRNLCLPFLRWLHRAQRPRGIFYPMHVEGKIRNYMLGYDELAMDPAPAIAAFEEWEETHGYGKAVAERAVAVAQAEIAGPFHFLDAIYCVNLDREPERFAAAREQFRVLQIELKVRRFPAADTPLDARIGRALSHRRIIAEAKMLGLETVLVFDDGVRFFADAAASVARSLRQLESDWQLLYLGGILADDDAPALPGRHLTRPAQTPCACAVAYRYTAYDTILEALPDEAVDAALALGGGGFDQFLAGLPLRAYLATPPAVSWCGRQPSGANGVSG